LKNVCISVKKLKVCCLNIGTSIIIIRDPEKREIQSKYFTNFNLIYQILTKK